MTTNTQNSTGFRHGLPEECEGGGCITVTSRSTKERAVSAYYIKGFSPENIASMTGVAIDDIRNIADTMTTASERALRIRAMKYDSRGDV